MVVVDPSLAVVAAVEVVASCYHSWRQPCHLAFGVDPFPTVPWPNVVHRNPVVVVAVAVVQACHIAVVVAAAVAAFQGCTGWIEVLAFELEYVGTVVVVVAVVGVVA